MIDTTAIESTLGSLPMLHPHSAESIKKTAEDFESMFLSMLLEPMEKAGEAFFGEGQEGRVFGNMFRMQLAEQMAKVRPLGIADRIETALTNEAMRTQMAAQSAQAAYQEGTR